MTCLTPAQGQEKEYRRDAAARVTLGFQLGVNTSFDRRYRINDDVRVTYEGDVGTHIGGVLNYFPRGNDFLKKHLALRFSPAFFFSGRSRRMEYEVAGYTYTESAYLEESWLQMPLMLKLRTNELARNRRLYAAGGLGYTACFQAPLNNGTAHFAIGLDAASSYYLLSLELGVSKILPEASLFQSKYRDIPDFIYLSMIVQG